MVDSKIKYRTDSKGVKVKLTFDEENKVWRSRSKEFDQEPLPENKRPSGLGAALKGGGRAFYKGGRVGFSSGYSTFGKRSGPRKSGGTGGRNK